MRRVCYRLRGRSPFQARGANWVKKATVALESGVNARAEKLDTAREIIGNSVNGIGISDLPIIHSGFTLEHINDRMLFVRFTVLSGWFRFVTTTEKNFHSRKLTTFIVHSRKLGASFREDLDIAS